MDFKEIIKKVKVLLSVKVDMANFKTSDGEILQAEKLEEGMILSVVTEDGLIPCTAGDYTLEDETVVTCDDTGMITAIVKPEAPAEPIAEEEVPAVAAEEVKPDTARLEAIEADLATMKADFVALGDTLNKLADAMSVNLLSQVKPVELVKPVETPKPVVKATKENKKFNDIHARVYKNLAK